MTNSFELKGTELHVSIKAFAYYYQFIRYMLYRPMKLHVAIFLLTIIVLRTAAKDEFGNDVVNLEKDSFDKELAKLPHFVLFFVPW